MVSRLLSLVWRGYIIQSQSTGGHRRRRTRTLLLTLRRRVRHPGNMADHVADRVGGRGKVQSAFTASQFCSKTERRENGRKKKKRNRTPMHSNTHVHLQNRAATNTHRGACALACTAAMDRCHPCLDVIYDGPSIEATVIWGMMTILI